MGRSLYEWKDNKTRFRNRSIKCIKQRKNRLKKYDVNVTEKGVTDTLKGETGATAQIPEAWKANVINIVDTVPIPKGFVASSATGENTKNGGLVIYEGTESVTDSNVEDAKRTRNQYVWVPVEDFSKFIRQNFGGTDKLINTIENVEHMDNWEVTLNETTNMPLPTQDENYFTQTTLKEVQAMYSSVKEYKGFYIARYEIGLDIGSHKTEDDGEIIKTVHSKMNKAPYNYVRWAYNNVTNEDTMGR